MGSERLALFTDAVLAIVITLIVLELPLPKDGSWTALAAALPLLGLYALTFVHLLNNWRHHQRAMAETPPITDRLIWANGFLLFWSSLLPFVMRWIGEAGVSAWPVALYGVCQLMTAVAWIVFKHCLATNGEGAPPSVPGVRWGEAISIALYVVGIAAAFAWPWLSIAIYALVLARWTVPDPGPRQAGPAADLQ